MTPEAYLEDRPEATALLERVRGMIAKIGPASVKVSKSQIAFRRRRGFAWLWRPDRYLQGERPPLVLSLSLGRRDVSRRWKEVVEPAPGRFMHHLELWHPNAVDDEVAAWLREAWDAAG